MSTQYRFKKTKCYRKITAQKPTRFTDEKNIYQKSLFQFKKRHRMD